MNLGLKNKIDAGFSIIFMIDLVFLLLLFFMLTSSFVTPSGHPINLPAGKAGKIEIPQVAVTVTKDLEYYVNDKRVTKGTLEGELKSRLKGPDGAVVLHIDRNVSWGDAIFVTDIASALEARVIVATKPN